MRPEINDRILRAYPQETYQPFYRAVKKGVLLADDAIDSVPFLKNAVGNDLRGHLRRAGIMFSIDDACTNGDLPFKTKIARMPIGHWNHLEIYAADTCAYVCRVEKPGDFPKDTPNRQDLRLGNQPDLFDWDPQGQIITFTRTLELCLWVLVGLDKASNITTLALGAPDPKDENWLGYINILREMNNSSMIPSPSTPRPGDHLKFRSHIEELLNGQNKNDKAGE